MFRDYKVRVSGTVVDARHRKQDAGRLARQWANARLGETVEVVSPDGVVLYSMTFTERNQ